MTVSRNLNTLDSQSENEDVPDGNLHSRVSRHNSHGTRQQDTALRSVESFEQLQFEASLDFTAESDAGDVEMHLHTALQHNINNKNRVDYDGEDNVDLMDHYNEDEDSDYVPPNIRGANSRKSKARTTRKRYPSESKRLQVAGGAATETQPMLQAENIEEGEDAIAGTDRIKNRLRGRRTRRANGPPNGTTDNAADGVNINSLNY